jgi:hypothetical protein
MILSVEFLSTVIKERGLGPEDSKCQISELNNKVAGIGSRNFVPVNSYCEFIG